MRWLLALVAGGVGACAAPPPADDALIHVNQRGVAERMTHLGRGETPTQGEASSGTTTPEAADEADVELSGMTRKEPDAAESGARVGFRLAEGQEPAASGDRTATDAPVVPQPTSLEELRDPRREEFRKRESHRLGQP